MPDLQNDNSKDHPSPTNVQQETNIYEDEINLIDYFLVFWKRKYLILLGSILPVLIFGLFCFFSPRNYKVTYAYDVREQGTDVKDQDIDIGRQSVYTDAEGRTIYVVRNYDVYGMGNWDLNENNYKILLDRFYSTENLNKIVEKLHEMDLVAYSGRISQEGRLKKFVHFEVSPPFFDLSKAGLTEPANLEQLRQLKALLLNMTIIGRPKNDITKISSIIRDNLENVISVYMVKDQLGAATRKLRANIAGIEENRVNLERALKTNKLVSAKLKNIKTKTSDTSKSNIALQFDISGKTEYLPVEYQVQAVESKTIQIEEEIAATVEEYNYYKDLIILNEKLLAELKDKTSSYYTIQQFHSYLTELIDSYETNELKDYLSSYTKRLENRIVASVPVTENPGTYAVSKGTVKKSAIVFAVAFMMSVFTSFLLEGLKKSQAQTS